MAFDEKRIHAEEFTQIERTTLRVWFDLDSAGNDQLAETLLVAGLQYEHYTSLLPSDRNQRTIEEIAEQSRLAFEFTNQLNLAQEFFRNAQDPKRHDRVARLKSSLSGAALGNGAGDASA